MARASDSSDPPAWFGKDQPGDLFEITDATLAGAPVLVEIFGPSESGKTLTALLLARGLAGDDGDVGLMDTEGGRGRLFANRIPGRYKYGWLRPPFTVEKYEAGIELFLERVPKLRALVIDSASHCWSAQGGVLDQVDAAELAKVPMRQRWTKPKRRYNRFLDYLTTSRLHIILCSRARQPLVEEQEKGKAAVMVRKPWVPIRSPSLQYDLTVCLPMTKAGYYDLENPLWKCAQDLRHLFPGGEHRVSIETGREIARWVAGEEIDLGLELLSKRAFDAAANGTLAMRKFYEGLTRDQRTALKPQLASLQSAVVEADRAIEMEQLAKDESGESDLDNPFVGQVVTVEDANAANGPIERNEAFWTQHKLVVEARDDDEFVRLTKQYLDEARDVFDVNGIEIDNSPRIETLAGRLRTEVVTAIETRRAEFQAKPS